MIPFYGQTESLEFFSWGMQLPAYAMQLPAYAMQLPNATVPVSGSPVRVIYQWLRWEQFDQWWKWLLLLLVIALVVGHVITWYRRDWGELARPAGWALVLLRLAAFVGLLLYFFHLEKRTEQRVVRHSRVAVLVDSSLSMSAAGTPSPSGVPADGSRSEEVARMLTRAPLLQELSQRHDVSVYRFDQSSRPTSIAALKKGSLQSAQLQSAQLQSDAPLGTEQASAMGLSSARRLVLTSGVLMLLALMMILVSLGAQFVGARDWLPGAWLLLAGSFCVLVSLALAAVGIVPNTDYSLASLLGRGDGNLLDSQSPISVSSDASLAGTQPIDSNGSGQQTTVETDPRDDQVGAGSSLPADWLQALNPTGVESRIGDSVKSILDQELGNPQAGIVLITDGRNNSGMDPKATLAAAQNARVPLYVVGVGSDKRPANLQMVEVDAPKRLYPGDRFSVTALLGFSGFEGRSVTVQFLAGRPEDPLDRMQLESETTLEIPSQGTLVTTSVELPPKSVGKWSYVARVIPLSGEAEESDNAARTEVEVVERRNRVLVAAGGPLREYQFARNLLYRDEDVESHVLLQSGGPATSQEAQSILESFPADLAGLSDYDAVLAFDLDWTKIPEKSVQALERWVGEQAGGLLLLAGPVETPKWLARSASGLRSQVLRDLSPVVLDVRGSALLAAGRVEGESVWPLTITPDGRQNEFLWLTDEAQSSMELWQSFPGVHTFYSAYELKPGAKALALFSDPTAAAGGQQPIYLASQFYGAGRVVFQGGGELWRLRELGDQYFDRYYTKLVRWISQGRLLLDSDRGVLLVDREEAVQGEQVSVRAVLKNEMYEPLVQSEVVARLIDPQGLNVPLVLRPLSDGSQPGVYTGQFPILAPGVYRLQLQLGGLSSEQFLQAQVRARVPKLEMQVVERNDELLGQLATETGGQYWVGCASAVVSGVDGQMDLPSKISTQDQIVYAPGAPDREFQLRWLGWLMTWIASSLSLEWLSRRVHRLA